MGELIEFRPATRSTRARSIADVSGGAQILLFTGIRYERHIEGPEPRTPESAGSKDGARRRRRRASA